MVMDILRNRALQATRGFLRFARQETGIAAVEFSLILPILVVLWFGGVEVTQALSLDRRLNNLASAIGDLVARSREVTAAEVAEIFEIAPGALFPYCRHPHTMAQCTSVGLTMRITAVLIDEDGNAEIHWYEESGTPPTQLSLNTIIPETLRSAPPPGQTKQIIMSEVYKTYTPAVGYVITGDMELEDRMFFVPRLVAEVQCNDCDS